MKMNSVLHFRALIVNVVFSFGMFGVNCTYANEEMWDKLAKGGKVILMRHASVDTGPGKGDYLLRDPSCQKERNLSNQGKHEARIVGERFRKHNILISKVHYSPFCRTTDTAKLAFSGGTPADFLSLLEILGPDEAADQTERLNRIISSYVGEGNLILITHEPNIRAISFELLKHSDFLVLQPEGGEEFEELGVVRWDNSK